MKIVLFNALSGLQVRGISKVADELSRHLRKKGHTVVEIKIPKVLYGKSAFARVFVLIIFQQIVCPIVALLKRSDLIIDPYNGYSIFGSLFVKTKYFINDYTAFKRAYWYLHPGSLYQLFLFKIDRLFNLAEMYHISSGICTPQFLKRTIEPKIFPCIVDPIDCKESSFFKEIIAPLLKKPNARHLLVSTISGNTWNKDFDGLLGHLESLDRSFTLLALGFEEYVWDHKTEVINSLKTNHIIRFGFVEESFISSAIKHSDIFIFHSLSEGFGRPILEALQLGKIVITSHVPILNILSEEAKNNVYTYKTREEFQLAVEAAVESKFIHFTDAYNSAVNQSIDHLTD